MRVQSGKKIRNGMHVRILADVILDEQGISIKNISSNKCIELIKEAENTEYLEPLLEVIKNNPKFDLEKFAENMKLEDIVSDTPSKIALLAKSKTGEFLTSRIVTKEQSEILKQCIKNNENYNFNGATDENHGFDIETFGIDFISKLDYGMDEHTYNTIIQNKELLENIKSNPDMANYMAKAVNEYRNIQEDIKSAPKENFWYYDEGNFEFHGITKEQLIQEEKEDGQRFFCIYNEYEDDIADLKSLFQERLENLDKNEKIEDFEVNEYGRYSRGNKKIITVNEDTLEEKNAIEYLKESGQGNIEISDTDIENNLNGIEQKRNQFSNETEHIEPTQEDEYKINQSEDHQKQAYEEKNFFKKITEKIRGLFNKNKRLPPPINENTQSISTTKDRRKEFIDSIFVREDELRQNAQKEQQIQKDNEKNNSIVKDDEEQDL